MERTTLSVVGLLIRDEAIPVDIRLAIVEGRTEDAGRRLMELFDLNADEVMSLVSTPGGVGGTVCYATCCW